MASPAPLFVSDRDELLKRVRLSKSDTTGDSVEVIDQGMRVAALEFFKRLGVDLVTDIKAYSSTEPPTTDEEVLRMQAAATEIDLVRLHLYETLPILFADASADAGDVFQGEEPFNQTQATEEAIARLQASIEEGFALLEGAFDPGTKETVHADTFEPDLTDAPTVIPGNRYYPPGGYLRKPPFGGTS
jgi:hypothetical protein